jgi:hypothetical protein
MSLYNDLARAIALRGPGIRVGQAWFNELYRLRPDLADQIRATNIDPFFSNDPEALLKAYEWLQGVTDLYGVKE